MPELPEVETTRRGIEPQLVGQTITGITIRKYQLRWPIAQTFKRALKGAYITRVSRRAKYLLIDTTKATIIIHLGMSGKLRIIDASSPVHAHDHVDWILNNKRVLRFTDPRRFGSIHYTQCNPLDHPLLRNLGPEPLARGFTGALLAQQAIGRRTAIKQFLMDSRQIAGLGNIYANEALFLAGIHPARKVNRLSIGRWERLAASIKYLLKQAIKAGGSTLRDFTRADGQPGYFQMKFQVYGRAGKTCTRCHGKLRGIRQGQRMTVYCPHCQR
ncbi:MAG: bifunctional DNA-formamidopyrimidine glycosylase/DNA-(apurinic or apyrimidinic site) lyase [Gammaproteobacteria bacterium]|nr:MAG: bifunctional DNA-formamidopyrimidine glycosylase/DNA-(apurinic or apyrimidinic site) lyase [Gammaproteobacteria bacterium]